MEYFLTLSKDGNMDLKDNRVLLTPRHKPATDNITHPLPPSNL